MLKRFARKNTNLVLKFQPRIEKHLNNLSDDEKRKLDIVLSIETYELQKIMDDAYKQSNIIQYKILADSKNRPFIESNLNELKKIV